MAATRYRLVISLLLVSAFGCCGLAIAQDVDRAVARDVPPPNTRFHTEEQRDIRITTAVPSAAETIQIFGFGLYAKSVQPVWLEIENLGNERLWFLPTGVDEAYFTPIETSYRQQKNPTIFDWITNRNYYSMRMGIHVEPGERRSGYVFTRVDQGTKSFNVDVVSKQEQYRVSFFVPVPGLKLDHYRVKWEDLYAKSEIRDVDLDSLLSEIESLPCCVTNKKGTKYGDPMNLVVIGDLKDVYYGFMRAGWDETETIHTASLWKTMTSALSGNEYRYSPVSALYVYGRAQDIALQKARTSIHQRNHLRLWMSPLTFEGKPVWVGQISRDIGVRATWKTITTHKIDPQVDEAREYLLEDLAYAESIAGFGYASGVGRASISEPRGNLTGDPYFTDGLRLVMLISAEAVAIDEIDYVDMGNHPLLVERQRRETIEE